MTPTIVQETPLQMDVTALLASADRRAAELYPAESRHGSSAETLATPDAMFFVARLDGRAVGCGGFVRTGTTEGELKRIFVEDTARGTGIGRLLLTTLEAAARRRHIATMRLETGIKSTEAIGLYRTSGYVERGPFPPYTHDPLSVFMEKLL